MKKKTVSKKEEEKINPFSAHKASVFAFCFCGLTLNSMSNDSLFDPAGQIKGQKPVQFVLCNAAHN